MLGPIITFKGLEAKESTGSFIDRTYTYTLPEMYNDVPVDLAEIEVAAFITDGS